MYNLKTSEQNFLALKCYSKPLHLRRKVSLVIKFFDNPYSCMEPKANKIKTNDGLIWVKRWLSFIYRLTYVNFQEISLWEAIKYWEEKYWEKFINWTNCSLKWKPINRLYLHSTFPTAISAKYKINIFNFPIYSI